ncbi:MAG: NusG domain II-containing protein [Oscillospiraceae bacterium]|nr:NusG domain II-containing protein [Oscillospiraceae bacterium]
MKFIKKIDILIIAIILLSSLIFWGINRLNTTASPVVAEIYYKSKLVKTISLNNKKDITFSIPQKPNVIFHLYADGSIRFEKSDCRDKICVRSGKLNIVGESAACLPNEIILKIVRKKGDSPDDLDIILGK